MPVFAAIADKTVVQGTDVDAITANVTEVSVQLALRFLAPILLHSSVPARSWFFRELLRTRLRLMAPARPMPRLSPPTRSRPRFELLLLCIVAACAPCSFDLGGSRVRALAQGASATISLKALAKIGSSKISIKVTDSVGAVAKASFFVETKSAHVFQQSAARVVRHS
jgi:hypothetical protein